MSTIELHRPAAAPDTKEAGAVRRSVSKVRKAIASVMVTLAFVVAGASASSAATTPGTGEAETLVTNGFASVTSLFTGVIGAAIFGLTVLVLGIVVGIKWLRRGAKQG